MSKEENSRKSVIVRFLSEPMVQFFILGALLLGVWNLVVEERDVIVIGPGLEAELARRFQDQKGRPPIPKELEAELLTWKRDEILYREALILGLDREDAGVRTVLINTMRNRAALESPTREPSEEEIAQWFATHHDRFFKPVRYDFQFITFDKSQPDAPAEFHRVHQALKTGTPASTLGHPVRGAHLSTSAMKGRVAPALAARIPQLPVGEWNALEDNNRFFLTRLKRATGGAPVLADVRAQVIADWKKVTLEEATEKALQRIVSRYTIERNP